MSKLANGNHLGMLISGLAKLLLHCPSGQAGLSALGPVFHDCQSLFRGAHRKFSHISRICGIRQPGSDSACSDCADRADLWSSGFLFSQRRGPKLVKPKDIIHFWKIRVGDKVVVISGKDKGKVGEVLACDKLRNQVKVKDCNMRKLLVDGQTVMIEKKIHYSNVQLVDPLLSCGTRVAIRYNRDKEPLRVSKKSGYVIPWPEEKKEPDKELVEGEKDTKPEVALERTYDYRMDLESMQRLRQAMKKYNRDM